MCCSLMYCVVTHRSFKLARPLKSDWFIDFGIDSQADIAIKKTNHLIQQKCLQSCKKLHSRRELRIGACDKLPAFVLRVTKN